MPFDGKDFLLLPSSAIELMATPDHMLAWLRTKSPDEVVAESIMNPERCLGCAFLTAHGHPAVTFGGSYFGPSHSGKWPIPAWFAFSTVGVPGRLFLAGHRENVTAAQAIVAVERAADASKAS